MPDSCDPIRPRWRDPQNVQTIALAAVGVAAAWYMLQQLAPILRPLFVAVFLAYVLMPQHSRLRKSVGSAASLGLIGGAAAVVLVVLGLVAYASALGLTDELPQLQRRAIDLTRSVDHFLGANAPWARSHGEGEKPAEERVAEQLSGVATPLLSAAGGVLVEACVIALYLLFLLLGGSQFPDRIRRAYEPERADAILHIAGEVSAAIIGYLRAKVKSSLLLAVPVGVVLAVFGVKFALLWALLTFLCNFVPYVGTLIALVLPVGFAFLQLDPGWPPFAVAGLLLVCHVACASVVEPLLIGKAVGLSPLVVLASLAFWGLLWGLPGMFLAVPLTVVGLIVMGHFEPTRAVAKLLTD